MDDIKVVIFDFDNTLIDRQKAAISLMKEIIDEDFPSDRFTNEFRNDIFKHLFLWDREGHEPKINTFSKYIKYGHIESRTWEYYDKLWTDRLWRHTVIFDDTIKVLSYLSERYRLALLTNGSVYSQDNKLNTVKLKSWFEQIVITGTYNIHKPDTRIFDIMCDKLSVDPENCVYIGDSLVNDVNGSLNAGMKSIWMYPNPEIVTDMDCQRIYLIGDLLQLL